MTPTRRDTDWRHDLTGFVTAMSSITTSQSNPDPTDLAAARKHLQALETHLEELAGQQKPTADQPRPDDSGRIRTRIPEGFPTTTATHGCELSLEYETVTHERYSLAFTAGTDTISLRRTTPETDEPEHRELTSVTLQFQAPGQDGGDSNE